jgi:NAD+ synthetase
MEQYILTHGSFEMNKAIEESKEDPEVKKFFEETYRNNKDNFKEIFHAIMKGRITRHIINYMQNNAMNVDPITKKVKQSQYLPDYINRNYNGHIPTWSNKSDDLTLQNLQARVRLVVPWGIAVKEDKIALVTSNASEAALGYTTAGGDMHMGGVNPIGGIPKAAIQRSLLYFEEQGLVGLKPIPALYLINNQEPTAELRPNIVDEKGKIIAQTDESDLGFTYTQSEAMEHVLITQRNTPLEAFKILKDMQEKGSSKKLFNSDADVYSALVKFAVWRWPAAQFKRIMGTLAPFTGANFDPHATVRTTVFADHFRTGCALLGLELLQNSIDKDVYKNAKNAIPRSANLKGAFANSALFMPAEHNARSKLANELAAIPAW